MRLHLCSAASVHLWSSIDVVRAHRFGRFTKYFNREKQSNRGMYVGMSDKHAGNVPLVLNFETGNITAQWNVVFDDWFSTVATNVIMSAPSICHHF